MVLCAIAPDTGMPRAPFATFHSVQLTSHQVPIDGPLPAVSDLWIRYDRARGTRDISCCLHRTTLGRAGLRTAPAVPVLQLVRASRGTNIISTGTPTATTVHHYFVAHFFLNRSNADGRCSAPPAVSFLSVSLCLRTSRCFSSFSRIAI